MSITEREDLMNFGGFFGVVSTVDFALLGLWWVTVQARPDLRARKLRASQASYLVSLQFVVPGTAALLAQVDPQVTGIWRVSFTIAGLSGVLSILLLTPSLKAGGTDLVLKVLRLGAVPLYAIVAVIAVLPSFPPSGVPITALQLEAVIFCLMAFLSSQIAWAVAMSE